MRVSSFLTLPCIRYLRADRAALSPLHGGLNNKRNSKVIAMGLRISAPVGRGHIRVSR